MRLSISQRMPHGRLQAAIRVQSPPVTGERKARWQKGQRKLKEALLCAEL